MMPPFVTPEELDKALADRKLDLEQLPLRALTYHLEQHWFPEAPTALLRKSVTAEVMGVLPHLRITNAGTQNIVTGGGPTAISFGTVIDDTDGLASTLPMTSVTIRNEGRYILTGATKWAAGGTSGFRALEIQRNGNQLVPVLWYPGNEVAEQNVATTAYLLAGDIITLKGSTTSVGNLDLHTSRLTLGFFSS